MNPEPKNRIISYLNGDMDDTSSRAFEQECKDDPEMMELLKLELQTRFVLRETAKKVYTQNANPIKTPQFPAYRLAAAILIFVLLGVSLYFILNKNSATPTELYADNYSHPVVSQIRDANQPTDSLWISATQAYTQQDWNRALSLFQSYEQETDSAQNPQLYLLLGICQIETQQFSEAISSFNSITNPRHPYYYDSHWYAALTHLSQSQISAAKEELNVLLQSNVYKERAQELLSLLE